MGDRLRKPRPAVAAFFEIFGNNLDDHFSGEITVPEKDAFDLLNHYIGLETLLHSGSDGIAPDRATEITRKDVRLMMAVYLWEVFYLTTNGSKDNPVMAAYEFVVKPEFFSWARNQPTSINLMKSGGIFDAVWSRLNETGFRDNLNAIKIDVLGVRDFDYRVADFSVAYWNVMNTDGAGAGGSESDRPSAVIPFPEADKGSVAQLIGRPRSILSGAAVRYILGAAAAGALYGAQALVNNARESGTLPSNMTDAEVDILVRRVARARLYDWASQNRGNISAIQDRLLRRAEGVRQAQEALPPPEQVSPEPDGFQFDEEVQGQEFSGIGRGGSEPEPGQRDEVIGTQPPGPFRSGYVEWSNPNGTMVTPPGVVDSSAVSLSAQEFANFNRERAKGIRGFMNVVVRLPQNIFGRLLLPVSAVADLVTNELEKNGRVEFIPSDSGGSGTVLPVFNLTGSPGITNPFGISGTQTPIQDSAAGEWSPQRFSQFTPNPDNASENSSDVLNTFSPAPDVTVDPETRGEEWIRTNQAIGLAARGLAAPLQLGEAAARTTAEAVGTFFGMGVDIAGGAVDLLTNGDLDSAPEGSQSPLMRRKRAFLDHARPA